MPSHTGMIEQIIISYSPIIAEKDPEHVAAGLKSAISNPNVSEGAKVHAAERLDDMRAEEVFNATVGGHEINHILGGYKATLHSELASS